MVFHTPRAEPLRLEAGRYQLVLEHPTYGQIKQVASPIATEGANQASSPGPTLGQHTDEILTELLSMDQIEIKELRKRGAVH